MRESIGKCVYCGARMFRDSFDRIRVPNGEPDCPHRSEYDPTLENEENDTD